MPKSVRQVQAKMGQFGYILVPGYLSAKIYPDNYIPRKHITGHTCIMLSPIVYPKSHLKQLTSDSLRHRLPQLRAYANGIWTNIAVLILL